MADEKSRIEMFCTASKNIYSLARDLAIGIIVLVIIFQPQKVSLWMKNANIKKIEAGGFVVEQAIEKITIDTKKNAEQLSVVKEKQNATISSLESLQTILQDDKDKAILNNIISAAKETQVVISNATQTVTLNLIDQQRLASQISDIPIPDTGWIYIGMLNSTRNAWDSKSPETISKKIPYDKLTPDYEITLTDDVYLREGNDKHSKGKIITAFTKKTTVKILTIDKANAQKYGGVWAKVTKVR